MAATATQQVINNGPRNLVLKYTIAGTTGDTSLGTLVDVSALDTSIGDYGLKLQRAEWSITGFSCKLMWDGAPDVDLIELSTGEGELDFTEFGGVVNNASQQSGDVLFTTTGYTASGDGGHFTLYFKKKNAEGFSEQPGTGSLTISGLAPTPA